MNPEEALNKAIEETGKWVSNGWPMDFGPKRVSVPNLEEAEKLNRKFSFRIEAVAYWTRVKNSSQEAVNWGKKALEALKKGNKKEALDCAYYALIVEKPIHEKTPTWSKAVEALQ